MELPEYVTVDEVKRVCRELNIRDWTTLREAKVLSEETKVILKEVNVEGMNIDLDDFCRGLEVELEHGLRFKDANVTNNHPILTGKIVLAHLKETLDYYKRLEVAELEGDLLKALVAKDLAKIEKLYKELSEAKRILSQAESEQLATE
jgi:DNA-binding Xre family transcriptional regulator